MWEARSLGFTFAVFPFLAFDGKTELSTFAPFIAILMLWPFLFDTVITFFRRLFRRDKVWTPHRDHLYQRMIKNGYTHSFVSKLYGLSASIIVMSVVLAVQFQGVYAIAPILITALVTVLLLTLRPAKKALT
jgi:UDP-N-acetylmuramyl pentapeptide phosphotransferase/UDP-N-acetylglucosamine-1-phosphate transferase